MPGQLTARVFDVPGLITGSLIKGRLVPWRRCTINSRFPIMALGRAGSFTPVIIIFQIFVRPLIVVYLRVGVALRVQIVPIRVFLVTH